MASRGTNGGAASWAASAPNRRTGQATQQLIVFPHGEVATRDIVKSKLCTQADSRKQCCENLARKITFDDFNVPSASGHPAALTLFDTEIRSDIKLLAFFKPDPMLGLQQNAWAKAVLPPTLRTKITIFGPVLVVILHSIGKEQSLLPLEGGPPNLLTLLTARKLPRPNVVATASATVVQPVRRQQPSGAGSRDGVEAQEFTTIARRPQWLNRESAVVDLDLKKDVDPSQRLIIPCQEKLLQVIEIAESKLPPHRRCLTSADEERYGLGGQVESRMKTVVCKHFCDDEVCMHVRPPARRVFSGHAEGCSFSHHPSRFQQVPPWCLDDPGFICWCLKHLPHERQVVHEILIRLIDQFERLQDCPICFIKHPPISLHREGAPALQSHVACANCAKQILEQESPTCPVCREEISEPECRLILEGIKHDGWSSWRDVANEIYTQLGGSSQEKDNILGSNWDTDSDFVEQQDSSEIALEEQEAREQAFSLEDKEQFRGAGEEYELSNQVQMQDIEEALCEEQVHPDWETPLEDHVEDSSQSLRSCGEIGSAACQAPSLNGLSLLPPVGAPPPPPRPPPRNVRPPLSAAVGTPVDSFFHAAAGSMATALTFQPPPPPENSIDCLDLDCQAEFRCWLQDQQLSEYEAPLREKGADRLTIMQYVLDADLRNIGMPLLHRRAMLNAADSTSIAAWRAARSGSHPQ